MARIPVKEFEFGEPSSHMHYLQCKNHPEMEYLWKGPGRSLHMTGMVWPECPCPFSDLIVLTDGDSKYDENGNGR